MREGGAAPATRRWSFHPGCCVMMVSRLLLLLLLPLPLPMPPLLLVPASDNRRPCVVLRGLHGCVGKDVGVQKKGPKSMTEKKKQEAKTPTWPMLF